MATGRSVGSREVATVAMGARVWVVAAAVTVCLGRCWYRQLTSDSKINGLRQTLADDNDYVFMATNDAIVVNQFSLIITVYNDTMQTLFDGYLDHTPTCTTALAESTSWMC